MKLLSIPFVWLLAFGLIITFWGCHSNSEVLEVKNGLLIENISLISPERDSVMLRATVVIQGDSILYAGKEPVKVRGIFRSLDGAGKYLIPGLIDSHVHISTVPGMGPEQEKAFPALAEAYRKQLPKSYLYFGFTTLIDLIGDRNRIQEFKRQPLAPDLYYAGSAIVANGYPMHYLPDSIRFKQYPDFVYLESESSQIPPQYKKKDHLPEAVINRIKESGAIAVKTAYEPGFDSPVRLPLPSVALLKELRDETHKQGLLLVAHGNSLEAHQVLTQAKVDIIAHGLWNWGRYQQADTLPAAIRQVLDEEIKKGIGYMPTLQVVEGLKALLSPDFLQDPQLGHVLPASLLAWYQTEAGQWYTKAIKGDASPEVLRRVFSRIAFQGRHALAYVAHHNGRILFSSDSPSAPTYGNPPGYNSYLEIQQMHQSGVSLRKILSAATLDNAKAFNLAHWYGTIQKGKKANLVILQKNPLSDISAYDAIQTVILRGKPIERATLSVKSPQSSR